MAGPNLSRRSFLAAAGRGSAVAVTIPGLLALIEACGQGSGQQTPTQVAQLRMALGSMGTEALDPLRSPNNNGVYLRLMFDHLVGADLKGEQLSKDTGIAKDWTISADAKTYTFKLRSGVHFQNGDEVTADDVKFSLDRLATPQDLTTTGATIAKQTASVEVVDKYTVRVNLKVPTATLLYRLSPLVDVAGLVLSKNYYDKVGSQGFDSQPMGSGPYKLVDRQVGSLYHFAAATSQHWAFGKPRYKSITMSLVTDESQRVAQLRSGSADFIDVGIEQGTALKSASGIRLFKHGSPDPLLIFFNNDKADAPTRDINVRKALSYAINRDELNKSLFQSQGLIAGNIFPGQLGRQALPADPFDVAQAQQLLNQTAYGAGKQKLQLQLNAQVRSAVPQMQQLAQVLQSYWQKIGVDVQIVFGDYGTWRAKAVGKTLPSNAAELLDIGGRPDNSDTATVWFSTNGLLSMASDPQMDQLAAQWSSAPNDQAYRQAAVAAEKYMHDQELAIAVLGLPVFFAGSAAVPSSYSVGQVALGFTVAGLVATS
jgi:peptide/nickel transport system substrate-binding protein